MRPNIRLIISYSLMLMSLLVACHEEEIVIAPENGLTADAGEDIYSKVNEPTVINGTGSNDKFNNPFQVQWTFTLRPAESVAPLTEETSLTPGFTPDKEGDYVLKLKLSQGEWSAEDEVTLHVASAGEPNEEPNEPQTVLISENIDGDKTLIDIFDDASKPDYIVTADIEVRGNLVIEPGVIIAFQSNRGLQIVQGSISAEGTAENRIIFKGVEEWPGYWKGIMIHSNSDLNKFNYVKIEHGGGSSFPGHVVKANLILEGTQGTGGAIHLANTKFNGSLGYGLFLMGSSTLNSFMGNQFMGNSLAAYIPAGQLSMIDEATTALGNGVNDIETGGETGTTGDVVWNKIFSGTIRVKTDLSIRHGVKLAAGLTLKMNEGVTIRVIDAGYLDAQGKENEKIVFDALAVGKYWSGIYFNSYTESNNLINTEVLHGGKFKMADAPYAANIYVGYGLLNIKNSEIRNGLGYGIVSKYIDRVNNDVAQVNYFSNLQLGSVFPQRLQYPDMPSVLGEWVDQWTFQQGTTSIVANYYNKNTGVWFDGAPTPWTMTNAGFGIRFDDYGNFSWNIAEHSPFTGCESYSAELIQGTMSLTETHVYFSIQYWRSRFVNSCDTTQNVDTNVDTFDFSLPYTISKKYYGPDGQYFWEMKFTNPDGSAFSLYHR